MSGSQTASRDGDPVPGGRLSPPSVSPRATPQRKVTLMLLYTVRRLIASALVLLASSALVFVLVASTVDPLAQFRTRQPPPS